MSDKKPKAFFTIKQSKSFTLVELLLGLAIFALISVGLYNMMYSGIKLEAKSGYIHTSYNEARLVFDTLSTQIPSALTYDFSGSYPDKKAFEGSEDELTFLLPVATGIDVVHYYAGRPNMGRIEKTILAGVVKSIKSIVVSSKQEAPVDFFILQQMPLAVWLSRQVKQDDHIQILSASLKKGGLKFAYSASSKELDFKPEWHEASLPEVVRVTLTLFDPKDPDGGVELTREFYLT